MISNDTPIDSPQSDEFGVDPFATAIAKSIEKLTAPEGTVLAITGPWGSGKSSVVNLIRHHLKPPVLANQLSIIDFNPWWYKDEESLLRGFFQHLYAGLGKHLSEGARAVILALAKKMLSSSLISTAVGFFTFGLAGAAAKSASSLAADMIKSERTAEEDFRLLSEALRQQSRRFLIVVDDIDRLTPEQSLLVFRLVKSVGRLPNVIYLLVFDRGLADRLVAERYPAERHFLEKIVQAMFEVPLPDSELLHQVLLRTVVDLTGHPEGEDGVRFRNLITDAVNPLIELPRDLVRYLGNLRVSWGAIAQEVDAGDLIAIEALRLFRFSIYRSIQANKALLCGPAVNAPNRMATAELCDRVFLSDAASDTEREFRKRALRRLFPMLDSVWSNLSHGDWEERIWRTKRRICHPAHFSTYFRLALDANALPRKVIDGVIANAGNSNYVKGAFLEHSKVIRRNGKSEVPTLLDELTAAADRISPANVGVFLGAIFSVADDIDNERDGVFGSDSNSLRIHWLTNELVRDRMKQTERGIILLNATKSSGLGWAVDFASRVDQERSKVGNDEVSPANRLVDADTATRLVADALGRIRAAALADELLPHKDLLSILFRWREFANDEGKQVRAWTTTRLDNDAFVVRMVGAVTSTTWVSGYGFDGMGDRVSRGIPHVQLEGLETILDVPRFFKRIEEIEPRAISSTEQQIFKRFREGMRENELRETRRRRAGAEEPIQEIQQSNQGETDGPTEPVE